MAATPNGAAAPEPLSGPVEIDSDVEVVPEDKLDVDLDNELAVEEDAGDADDDPERLPREAEPYPKLHNPAKEEPKGRAAKVLERITKEAGEALQKGDVTKAVDKHTEAMRIGGSTALMLATRGALLLKQRRPCAAVRDCTAALKINALIGKAYRIRGIAHRKLGNWHKAHRDLSEAQELNFDEATAEVQKFVAGKMGTSGNARDEVRLVDGMEMLEAQAEETSAWSAPVAQPAGSAKELEKGQPVRVVGLQKAPYLNGTRGVVQRRDPRPTAKGRWEIELRLDGGRLDVKSFKGENIMTLNKVDKAACRAWMREEKEHQEEIRRREDEELERWRKKEEERKPMAPPQRLEARMAGLGIREQTRALLRQLETEQAMEIIQKATEQSGITNLNLFLANQARMVLGCSDSEDEGAEVPSGAEEPLAGIEDPDDPERLREDTDAFPPLPPDMDPDELTEEQLEKTARAKQAALEALERADVAMALDLYTEAIQCGGATALMLTKRGELLLKQKRPCAAIRDCSAAIAANSDCAKAYRVRGIALRRLGRWEEAQRDLAHSQRLDFDEGTLPVENFVAVKVNALQERGVTRRRSGLGEPPSKRPKAI